MSSLFESNEIISSNSASAYEVDERLPTYSNQLEDNIQGNGKGKDQVNEDLVIKRKR